MDYKDNNNARNQNHSRSNRSSSHDRQKGTPLFKDVDAPLSEHYRDTARLYLTDGFAHRTAKMFQRSQIATHQLRKVLFQAKQAVTVLESGSSRFNEARSILFMLLPMSAYNTGRSQKLRPLYEFLKANISETTIRTPADVDVFDSLMTSIVAYHKYEEEMSKNRNGRRS